MSISEYRGCLREVVKELTLHESKWGSEEWRQAWKGINQEVLNDAFAQHGIVCTLFADIGEITQRNCKSLARVEKKMAEQAQGRENFFKVVSDFVAVRVPCELSEIQEKIDRIREVVFANSGEIHIRGLSKALPHGFFIAPDKKYADITQCVYVFLEKVGYPIEFQIGHKFASYAFTIDSALRDNPECGSVDLWKNGFYFDVRKYILSRANGGVIESKDAIYAKAADLHPDGIPEDLSAILSTL